MTPRAHRPCTPSTVTTSSSTSCSRPAHADGPGHRAGADGRRRPGRRLRGGEASASRTRPRSPGSARRSRTSRSGRILDLACGPADITVRFARAYPEARLVGLEGSPPMLALGRQRVAEAGLDARDRLRAHGAARPRPHPARHVRRGRVHELAAPLPRPRGAVGGDARHRRDRRVPVRPGPLPARLPRARRRRIVDQYAAGEPEVLRRDFYNSLCAAFTPSEIEAQLAAAGLAGLHRRAS